MQVLYYPAYGCSIRMSIAIMVVVIDILANNMAMIWEIEVSYLVELALKTTKLSGLISAFIWITYGN